MTLLLISTELQKKIVEIYNQKNLDLLEICIISDNIIEVDKLPEKVVLKSKDLECRIKYWDIKRWNDLKRSKSKRESINIDLKSEYYNHYSNVYNTRYVCFIFHIHI